MDGERPRDRTWLWLLGGIAVVALIVGCVACAWAFGAATDMVGQVAPAQTNAAEEATAFAGRPVQECYDEVYGRMMQCEGAVALACNTGPMELLNACIGVAQVPPGWCTASRDIDTCEATCSTQDLTAAYRCGRSCGYLEQAVTQGCAMHGISH